MVYPVPERTNAAAWQPFLEGRFSASAISLRMLDSGYCLDLAIRGETATLEETVELARSLDRISMENWRESAWVRPGDHHMGLRSPKLGDDYSPPGLHLPLVWPLIPLPPSRSRGGPAPTWIVSEEPPVVVQVLRFTLSEGEELTPGDGVDVRLGNGLFWSVWLERREDLVFQDVVVERQTERSRWWQSAGESVPDADK